MSLVIDAQLVFQYYKETVLGIEEHDYTESVTLVFNSITSSNKVYVDDQDHIYQEWQNLIRQEWLKIWYEECIINDIIVPVPVDTCHQLRRKLNQMGFPMKGGDFWYLRTAMSVRRLRLTPKIITEDIDFHDPTKKKTSAQERKRILMDRRGIIAKTLWRQENIMILCIYNYLALLNE